MTKHFRKYSIGSNLGAAAILFTLSAIVLLITTACWFAGSKPLDPPGEPVRFDQGKTWAFNPPPDPFREGALLDLRDLNEKEAGSTGFIRLDSEGTGFLRGDGKPVRFWAVGNTVYRKSNADLAYNARFLAKRGVNMVRMHGSITPKGPGKKLGEPDEKEIEDTFRLVAAMKKEGIYTSLSPFWANGGHSGTSASWGLEGYGDKEDIWALLFFNDDLKAAYKNWTRELLTRKNPYTGLPLGKDPAVAILQIQNEDSLFFWTLQGVKPAQLEILEKKYATWLTKVHGTPDNAIRTWKNYRIKGDNPANGRMALMPTWQMTQELKGGESLRMKDQVRFLAETQIAFYDEIVSYFRKDLECRQLINACNWTTADPEKLNDIERWTYTASDVQATNRYYGGGQHMGPNNGWRIDPGDFFEGKSVLGNPSALPVGLKQPVHQPMMITESSWTFPLEYESEGPFLVSAYSSMNGVGPFFWFNNDSPGYNLAPYFPYHTFPDGQKGIMKFNLYPGTITQFPAASILYRNGLTTTSKTVFHEERSLDNLWNREKPLLLEGRTFDPNRQKTFAEGADGRSTIDPLAFLAGKIEIKYGGNPAKTTLADFSGLIDHKRKTVISETGELRWNHDKKICTLDAKKAQGVTGFLAEYGGDISLSDTAIHSENHYATIMLVSMDDKPLSESGKILIQVGTTMRPTGWTTRKESYTPKGSREKIRGEKVVNTGAMPWQAAYTNVRISIRNPGISKVIQLDPNGYRQKDVPIASKNGFAEIVLPEDCIHAILVR